MGKRLDDFLRGLAEIFAILFALLILVTAIYNQFHPQPPDFGGDASIRRVPHAK